MGRGIGEIGPVQEHIPEWAAVLIALLTQLGDIWFLALVLTILYWSKRTLTAEIAGVAGVWLAGMGVTMGLKDVFGFPRPDAPLLEVTLLPPLIQPLYRATALASGYGFPSGHAVNATIVYFGLAAVVPVGSRGRRFLLAGGLVTTVCFTRVALGVHFLVDVVVGVILGAALLFVAWVAAKHGRRDPTSVALGLAIFFGMFFLIASDFDGDAAFVAAVSLGAFAGWQLVFLGGHLVALSHGQSALREAVGRGILALAGIAPLVMTIDAVPLLSWFGAAGIAGLATVGIVTVPVVRHSYHARQVEAAIRFWLVTAVDGVRWLAQVAIRRLRGLW